MNVYKSIGGVFIFWVPEFVTLSKKLLNSAGFAGFLFLADALLQSGS